MTTVTKEYLWPFALEETKFERVLSTIHSRMSSSGSFPIVDRFEVFLPHNRRQVFENLADVISMDNSDKHKIERVIVSCSTASSSGIADEVQVDFGGSAQPKSNAASQSIAIAIRVQSNNTGWASGTLAEVEEQIERIRSIQTSPVIILVGVFVLCFLLLFQQFGVSDPPTLKLAQTMWLQQSDLQIVGKYVAGNGILTDQEMKDVATRQLRNLSAAVRPPIPIKRPGAGHWWSLLVPVVVVALCGIYLLLNCYPHAMFVWGDGVERSKLIHARRKQLWGFIISIMVVGILSRLFDEGMFNLF